MFEARSFPTCSAAIGCCWLLLIRRRRLLLWGNLIYLSLRSLHVTAVSFAFTHLIHASCFLCPAAVAKCLTSSRWWISSNTIFLLFNVDFFDHQTLTMPRPVFPFATGPIISFILRDDSVFSIAIFAFHFRPVITEGEGWCLPCYFCPKEARFVSAP